MRYAFLHSQEATETRIGGEARSFISVLARACDLGMFTALYGTCRRCVFLLAIWAN